MKKLLPASLVLCLAVALAAVPALADSTLYNNTGPISDISGSGFNGDNIWVAWTINSGFVLSNSFNVASNSTIDSVAFDVWLASGDTLSSVNWSIGTTNIAQEEFDATGSAAGTTANVASLVAAPISSHDGYSIYVATIEIPDLPVSAGPTYWLTLQNAITADNSNAYWDIGNGPSVAWQNVFGNVNGQFGAGTNSDTFEILGSSSSPVPEPNSLLLFATGIAALAGLLRRKFAKAL